MSVGEEMEIRMISHPTSPLNQLLKAWLLGSGSKSRVIQVGFRGEPGRHFLSLGLGGWEK